MQCPILLSTVQCGSRTVAHSTVAGLASSLEVAEVVHSSLYAQDRIQQSFCGDVSNTVDRSAVAVCTVVAEEKVLLCRCSKVLQVHSCGYGRPCVHAETLVCDSSCW